MIDGFKIARPDEKASKQIFGIYLHEDLPIDNGFTREGLIDSATEYLWSKSKDSEFLKVMMKNGSTQTLYRKDLVSGALIKSIVDRAKDQAIKRAIENESEEHGIRT